MFGLERILFWHLVIETLDVNLVMFVIVQIYTKTYYMYVIKVIDVDFSRCTVMLQKEKFGEAITPGKSAARTLSCADALYKLYEKNDVIRVSLTTRVDYQSPHRRIISYHLCLADNTSATDKV